MLLDECRGTLVGRQSRAQAILYPQSGMDALSQRSRVPSPGPTVQRLHSGPGWVGPTPGAGLPAPPGQGGPAPSSRARGALTPRSCPASVLELVASCAQRRQPASAPGPPRCAPALQPRPALPRRGPSTAPRGPEPAERLPAGDLNGAAGPGAEGPAEGTGGPGRLPEGRPCVDAAGAGSLEQPAPSLPPGALWLEGKHRRDGATSRPWHLQGS